MPLKIDSITSEGLLDVKNYRSQLTPVVTSTDGTTSILATTERVISITGSATGHKIQLPNATTLTIGHEFFISNDSSQPVIANYYDNTTRFAYLLPKTRLYVVVRDVSTTNGMWIYNIDGTSSSFGGYNFYAYYGGNANSGRYLEVYPGSDSLTSPFLIISSQAIIALSLVASASVTATVSIYKTTDLVNPITTISLANETQKVITELFVQLSANDKIAIKVSSGSIIKPVITIYITIV